MFVVFEHTLGFRSLAVFCGPPTLFIGKDNICSNIVPFVCVALSSENQGFVSDRDYENVDFLRVRAHLHSGSKLWEDLGSHSI